MGMNSFSLRAEQANHRPSYETEISQLLELHLDGEIFPVDLKLAKNDLEYKPLDFSNLRSDWENPNVQRLAPGRDLHITVLIANHIKAFRTQSENVSTAGLLLRDLLPKEFSDKVFDVILILTDQWQDKTYLVYRGKAAGKSMQSRRIQFEAMTTESERKLQLLLEKWTPPKLLPR